MGERQLITKRAMSKGRSRLRRRFGIAAAVLVVGAVVAACTDPPSGVTASVNPDNSITVNWQAVAPSNLCPDITGYTVEMGASSGAEMVVDSFDPGTTYTTGALSPGTYYFTVTTQGFFGSSPCRTIPSSEAVATVGGTTTSPFCSATMSNPNPGDFTDDTVNISSNLLNAPVNITKHYKTTTSSDSGQTGPDGSAAITFDDSGATIGFTVQVDVSIAGGQATCSTSFTPT